MLASPQAAAPAPVVSGAEAAALASEFNQVMQALLALIDEETKLVRAGRVREAAKLAQPTAELARRYLADAGRVRAGRNALRAQAPGLLDELRTRHEQFRALLQINLTVLATAHAVAEGLVRGVSNELARKAAPQTYTAAGRNAAPPRAVPPMAISKRL